MKSDKRSTHFSFYKLIFQFGILFLLAFMGIRLLYDKFYTPDFEAYCPFGGIQAFGSYLFSGSLACSMTATQIIMGIVLAIGVMLFGKLFCGYVCPVGTVSEQIGRLGQKWKILISLDGKPDKILRSLKYVLLFITVFFTLKSSELFCKWFDPYYAIASGFNADVKIYYAGIALLVLFAGSLFVRFAWCKYLCPLGAISNIFRFSWFFLTIMGVYILLIFLGLKISWVWPLAIISAGGYLLEIWKKERLMLSPVAVSRSLTTCTNCNICTKACPQGIKVSQMVKVTHIDCNLCGDCVASCPEKDTLLINKKTREWLPALILALLIIAGLSLKSVWKIPTISEKWGNNSEIENAGIFTMDGLKNIKCFGSSMAFANKMREVDGVYRVETFVADHGVKIWYDRKQLNDSILTRILFTPVKKVLKENVDSSGKIVRYTLSIDQFFDPYDAYYLQKLLAAESGALSFQTFYNCPVVAVINFPANSAPPKSTLVKIIESEELSYTIEGSEFNVKLHFKVSGDIKTDTITSASYFVEMYIPVDEKFNYYYDLDFRKISSVKFPMGGNAKEKDNLDYLVSHLSNNKGIVGLSTMLDEHAAEWLKIEYLDSLITSEQVYQELNSDSLRFTDMDDKPGIMLNPFHFDE